MRELVSFNKNKRVLFLTKDLSLIKKQLYDGLNLFMKDLSPDDLLDNINTDIMTPAWVCFHYEPKEIAKRAYAGLLLNGKRVFDDDALINGNFEAIVSGGNKGCGSSRETAAQCEKYSGVKYVFAQSFAPIHARNNLNIGQVMGGYELLIRLQNQESVPFSEFANHLDPMGKKILSCGGLFPFLSSLKFSANLKDIAPKNKTMTEKIIAKKKLLTKEFSDEKSVVAKVDKGYSHEFTTAQAQKFLEEEMGVDFRIQNPQNYAAFEDHLIYAETVKKYRAFMPLIEDLRQKQRDFIFHQGIQDYSAKDGISPGICHEVARQDFILPGDFIQATDSHTCMGGALNALAFGVGATEYAAILAFGVNILNVPGIINIELKNSLRKNCSAKDVILYILMKYAKYGDTLNKIIEFTGAGVTNLSIDERATLCNMATECGAKTAICLPDEKLVSWLLEHREGLREKVLQELLVYPDDGCAYQQSIVVDLKEIEPMLAHPGDPDRGIPSDPTNGMLAKEAIGTAIQIAYGGSCTAGKPQDMDMYAQVIKQELDRGKKIPPGVSFYIQYGSQKVRDYAIQKGYEELFSQAQVKVIPPGCGACIGCGPGVSDSEDQVSISAINRNFQGRSGPGRLFLASPYTVAASAFAGSITPWLE